jgi:hypothetical protein
MNNTIPSERSLALVLPRLKESKQFFSKFLKLTWFIFFIGLFMNWFPGFVWVGKMMVNEGSQVFRKFLAIGF